LTAFDYAFLFKEISEDPYLSVTST